MSALDALRGPAHTGSNRCWPCTVLNLLLVGAFACWLRFRDRRVLGTLVAAAGVAIVYLRGYVVPYTPAFAPKLVAASPLPNEWFHDERSPDPADGEASLAATDLDGETVLRELVTAGVVEAVDDRLLVAEDVDGPWHDEMRSLAALSVDELAREVARSLPHVDETDPLVAEGRSWVVVGPGEGELVARPVAVAELAAYRVLADYLDDESIRLAAARALRMFLEECPACGTGLVETSEVSCCGGYAKPRQTPDEVLACPNCDQRLYTFPSGE
ncbi:hypothetical protein [Haloarcula nitratireducens]|uniref:Uncharacterized protein n=1 Tax=Haloarcula nitratireducens TaxID=2487749 RepID=A0AAW4P8Q6_9EURY|nr:hypothetical protein [Halomicroarcula nitratireducens]MBX0294131.1 hypothetical protein [Halomicroarcula nitratireducens]